MTSLLRTVENIPGGRLWYWPTPGNLTVGHSNVHIIDRTGSSLLGEIISQQENFSYFFEPLHSLRGDFRWTNQVAPNTEYVRDFVRSLLDCEARGIRKFTKDKFIVKKSKNVICSKESNVLIKAIRLTSDHIAELLHRQRQDNLPDLKIIHLVRWKPLTLQRYVSHSGLYNKSSISEIPEQYYPQCWLCRKPGEPTCKVVVTEQKSVEIWKIIFNTSENCGGQDSSAITTS